MEKIKQSLNAEVSHRILTVQSYDLENQQILCKDEGENSYKIQINSKNKNIEKNKIQYNLMSQELSNLPIELVLDYIGSDKNLLDNKWKIYDTNHLISISQNKWFNFDTNEGGEGGVSLLANTIKERENLNITTSEKQIALHKRAREELIDAFSYQFETIKPEWDGFNIDKKMENNLPVNTQIILENSYPIGVEGNIFLLEGNNIVKVVPAKEESYKIKHETKGRSFEQVDQIGLEMDELAKDISKNEKMGVQFRAVSNNEIVDSSVYIRMLEDNTLLDSMRLKQFAKDYEEYLKTIPELEGKKYLPEILVHYYPLDINNKNENISGEDKFIQSVHKVDNNRLINEVHTYDFSAREAKKVKPR